MDGKLTSEFIRKSGEGKFLFQPPFLEFLKVKDKEELLSNRSPFLFLIKRIMK